MVAILTGDIVNSRASQAIEWLDELKSGLNYYGTEPKQWEIYRGDSFQLSTSLQNALFAALHIKAKMKQSPERDVRIGIGLGEETHSAEKISESNGPGYVRSGACFESLKKQTLAIKSGSKNWDEMLNLMLSLALLTADNWTPVVAQVIIARLENPDKQQKEIAKLLNKSQSSVSEALKRGGFEEIMNLNKYYQSQIAKG